MFYTYCITRESCNLIWTLFKNGIERKDVEKATDLIGQWCVMDVDKNGFLTKMAIVPAVVYEQFKKDRADIYKELSGYCDECHRERAVCLFDFNSVDMPASSSVH